VTLMRAMVLEEVGRPLVLRELPMPALTPGHVLVRIAASAVNPLDVKIHAGQAPHARVQPPAILGLDCAGTIEAVGARVTDFAIGDEVFGLCGGVGNVPGSLCEFVEADARLLAKKPPALTMREAAALPLSFVTAYEGLVDRAAVAAGQRVLIHGGAGGVGSICVQLAVARGATTFATVSPSGRELVAGYGATPIDRATPVEEYVAAHAGDAGFDIVYDTVGGAVLDASFRAARLYGGHVVSCLGWGTHNLAPLSFRAATYSGVFTLLPLLTVNGRAHHGEILREAALLAERGLLRARLDPAPFALADANAAHALLAAGNTTGKIVVVVQ
jgi:NADPH:quinone reductase-like Zn-dependent oxidoreductase